MGELVERFGVTLTREPLAPISRRHSRQRFTVHHLPMALPFDCDRSSLLNYEFPPPVYYQGHTTGSTNSDMVTTVDHPALLDTPRNCIRVQAVLGFDSHCKRQRPIYHFPGVYRLDYYVMNRQQQPATHEAQVRHIFDMGISSAHRIAISSDHNQLASERSSLYHSVVPKHRFWRT